MKKKIAMLGVFTSICLGIVGCGEKKEQTEVPSIALNETSNTQEMETIEDTTKENNPLASVTFIDDLENQVVVERPQKVAVLSGSFANIWKLAGGEIYATSEDAWDDEGLQLTDDVVNVGSLKTPNVEEMIGAGVDFVILSANIDGHKEIKDTLNRAGIATAYFDVETFEDYLNMLHICAQITGNEEAYKENGEDVKAEIEEQIKRVDGTEKNVLLIRVSSSGAKARNSKNMTGKMLKDLGCTNIADSEKGLLEDLSMEAIIAQDPDYIFVTIMGDEEAGLKVVEELFTSNHVWSQLKAVKNNNYHVLEKELFHNKPNNRWGESYKILADILYGEQ